MLLLRNRLPFWCLFFVAAVMPVSGFCAESPARLRLRVENFTVPPATQPGVFVIVRNTGSAEYKGTLSLKGPDSWRIVPQKREIILPPKSSKRIPFSIEKGINRSDNSCPMEVTALAADGAVQKHAQRVFCASAPYFSPQIDGELKEWKDAIPIVFTTKGKQTKISTYWTRRTFSFCVEVQEEKLQGYEAQKQGKYPDAIQVAICSGRSKAPASVQDPAQRFEFLLIASEDRTAGLCFRLAKPGVKLAVLQKKQQALSPLLYEDATIAVRREKDVTVYECSLPFNKMRRSIRPTEGRTFFLSFLVHDPDGTGIRDLGEAAGLWNSQRTSLGWSGWKGVKWEKTPPFTSRLNWGFCSSKH